MDTGMGVEMGTDTGTNAGPGAGIALSPVMVPPPTLIVHSLAAALTVSPPAPMDVVHQVDVVQIINIVAALVVVVVVELLLLLLLLLAVHQAPLSPPALLSPLLQLFQLLLALEICRYPHHPDRDRVVQTQRDMLLQTASRLARIPRGRGF